MVLIRIILLALCFFRVSAYSGDWKFRDFRYRAEIIIEKDQNLIETFMDIISESQIVDEIKRLRIFSQQDVPVSNMRTLKNRIANDIAQMHKRAHIFGYYNAKINHNVQRNVSGNVIVNFHVNLGQKFNLKLNFHCINQNEKFNNYYASLLQKDTRKFKASIEEMKSLITIAVNHLQKTGFFKPEVLEKRVYINQETHEATLTLIIYPGQRVFFSDVEIRSFPGINEDFIKNRIVWERNEIFNIEKVELTAKNLKNTQIFSKVKIKPREDTVKDGKIPMIIKLQEDKKHTLDIGILYSGMRSMNFEKRSQTQKSLKSIIARLSWINCNAFGGGEKLSATVEGTPMKMQEKRSDYAFDVALAAPDVFLKNNTAITDIARRQELTNVFFKKNDSGSVIFSYPLLNDLLMRAGSKMEKTYVDASEFFFRNENNQKKYDTLSIPVEFIIDRTDNLLNPTTGYRIALKFSEMFFKKAAIGRLKTFDTAFSYNHPLDELRRTVLAFNVSRKSIFGQKIDAIPVDKRIYAGGMDSVRGYANQMATEMVMGEDTPMGGKSSLECNFEIRRKFSEDFGGVVFFDGAKVFQNKSSHTYLQTEEKRWFHSVGMGIRYFTSVGPIRFDFAFPVKRRRGVDSRVQFIMSLGQAF